MGMPYEEFKMFLVHTFTDVLSSSFTRWIEFQMTFRTYTQITVGETPPATVEPVEIPAPPCASCLFTVEHSASMLFFEERDTSVEGFPLNKPMAYAPDCQWDIVRKDRYFQALQKHVCMTVELDNKNSNRKFYLEKLTYGVWKVGEEYE